MAGRRQRSRASLRGYRGQVASSTGLHRVGAAWNQLPERTRSLIPFFALLTIAVTYPLYVDSLPTNVPVILTFPDMHSAVTILVFTMMAVGLNVVVGYCGLLDLGYVAFYALGAYTAGWLASGQFQQVKFHFGSVGITHDARDPHLDLARAPERGDRDGAGRHLHRPADPAAPRRLPRHRHARLR